MHFLILQYLKLRQSGIVRIGFLKFNIEFFFCQEKPLPKLNKCCIVSSSFIWMWFDALFCTSVSVIPSEPFNQLDTNDVVTRSLETSLFKPVRRSSSFPGILRTNLVDQLPVGLLAQLVRALHRYRRGQGSNPGKPDFFRLSFRYCVSCVNNCEDLFTFISSFRSSNIWISNIQNFTSLFLQHSVHCEHN